MVKLENESIIHLSCCALQLYVWTPCFGRSNSTPRVHFWHLIHRSRTSQRWGWIPDLSGKSTLFSASRGRSPIHPSDVISLVTLTFNNFLSICFFTGSTVELVFCLVLIHLLLIYCPSDVNYSLAASKTINFPGHFLLQTNTWPAPLALDLNKLSSLLPFPSTVKKESNAGFHRSG